MARKPDQGPLRSRKAALKIIDRFEHRVRMHEFKGAQHPDDHDEIDRKYREYKERLTNHLMGLKS